MPAALGFTLSSQCTGDEPLIDRQNCSGGNYMVDSAQTWFSGSRGQLRDTESYSRYFQSSLDGETVEASCYQTFQERTPGSVISNTIFCSIGLLFALHHKMDFSGKANIWMPTMPNNWQSTYTENHLVAITASVSCIQTWLRKWLILDKIILSGSSNRFDRYNRPDQLVMTHINLVHPTEGKLHGKQYTGTIITCYVCIIM